MMHLSILILVVALGIGLANLTVSVQLVNRYQKKYLKAYLVFLICLNATAVVSIFYNYFKENMAENFSMLFLQNVELSYSLYACILLIFVFGSLIHLMRGLIDETPSRIYLKTLLTIWVVLMLIFFSGIKTLYQPGKLPIPKLVNFAIDYLGILIVFGEIIRTVIRSKTLNDLKRRHAVKVFSGFMAVFWSVLVIYQPLMLTGFWFNRYFDVVVAVYYVGFNLIPLLFLKRFLERSHGLPETDTSCDVFKKELFERYNISQREQEIVDLICQGKANKEIADELYISLQTVKDHNYRIYRKLGVTNRVQVTNMFRQYEQ